MSKVIKSHQLILGEPVVIESKPVEDEFEQEEWEPREEAGETAGTDDGEGEESEPQVEEEPINLAAVQQEADKIIHETEQMVVEILEKARFEAAGLLADAREEAQMLKSQAEQEAVQLKEEAKQNGYREGYEAAMQETEDQRFQARQEAEMMIQNAVAERAAIIGSSEEVLYRLSYTIARKVVETEIHNTDMIVQLVKNIVDVMDDSDTVKILLNPSDYEKLAAYKDQFAAPGQALGNLELVQDVRISEGGCIAESDTGVIDAQIETRMENLENALMEVGNRE